MKFFKYLIIALFVFTAGSLQEAVGQNYTAEADMLFASNEFYAAIPAYQKAIKKISNREEKKRCLYNVAECYRFMNDNKRAESGYKRVIRMKTDNVMAWFYYAEALRINGKYEEAIVQYNEYLTKIPAGGDSTMTLNGIESCNECTNWINDPTRYEVTNMKKWNSRKRDYAPAFADRRFRALIFTSTRPEVNGKKKVDAASGQFRSDFFIVTKSKSGEWSSPANLDPEGDNINTGDNEATCALNARANTIYFTRCPYVKKTMNGCQIYSAKKRGKGWGPPEDLNLSYDSIIVVHPSITPDELTIYFSSNMEGGEGGMDIWMATRKKKTKAFGKPVNLGPEINTERDEMFPFIRNNGNLYFASNGLMGMGGLDIFVAYPDGEDGWQIPENMKVPINSTYDDFAMIFEDNPKTRPTEMGYMSSSRKGGRGQDDIYYFILPPLLFTISGTVTDDSTSLPIQGAIVQISGGSDGMTYIDTTDSRGYYAFNDTQIIENSSYVLIVNQNKPTHQKNKGYFGKRGKETTVGLKESKDMIHDFALTPIPLDPIILPDILYETAKWELRPEFFDSLDIVLETMGNHDGLVVEMGSHTDHTDTEESNYILSQKRAQSVVDYLVLQGVNRDRLVAKGYGEDIPRELTQDKISTINGKSFVFKAGIILTEEYVESLTGTERLAALQLNRRTTFKVLRNDFVAPSTQNDSVETNVDIEVIRKNVPEEEDDVIDEEEENPTNNTPPSVNAINTENAVVREY